MVRVLNALAARLFVVARVFESLFQSVSDWSKDSGGAEGKSKQYIPGWHLHELTENDDWLYVKKL